MKKQKLEVGEVYFNMTVLKELSPIKETTKEGWKRERRRILCICTCGKQEVTLLEYLKAERKKMCKQCLKNQPKKEKKIPAHHKAIIALLEQGKNQKVIAKTCHCSLSGVYFVKKKYFGLGKMYIKKDIVKKRIYQRKSIAPTIKVTTHHQPIREAKIIEPPKEGYFDYRVNGNPF